jgi:hypothetical protein
MQKKLTVNSLKEAALFIGDKLGAFKDEDIEEEKFETIRNALSLVVTEIMAIQIISVINKVRDE